MRYGLNYNIKRTWLVVKGVIKADFQRLRINDVSGLCFKYRRKSWRVRGHVRSFTLVGRGRLLP